MNSRCEVFEDAIWEHARTGTELPAEIRVHIDKCPHCAAQLKEAKHISSAMLACDIIPPAPDVRSAVRAKIAPRQKVNRSAWGYAFAGTALASLAVYALVIPRLPSGPSTFTASVKPPAASSRYAQAEPKATHAPSVAAHIAPTANVTRHWNHRVARVKPADQPVNSVQIAMLPKGSTFAEHDNLPGEISGLKPERGYWATDPASASESTHYIDEIYAENAKDMTAAAKSVAAKECMAVNDVALDSSIATRKAENTSAEVTGGFSTLAKEKADTVIDDDRPVAIAVVNWSSDAAVAQSNYSYSYKDIDPVTGRVTECKVRRNGDTVNIDLEAKPGIIPGGRGSVDYENANV